MRIKKDKTYCAGCYNNFYNGNNPYNVKECWNFKSAKVCTRYRIGVSTPMDRAYRFVEVKALNCYRETGYAYLYNIPKHLKEEWKSLIKEQAKRLEAKQ